MYYNSLGFNVMWVVGFVSTGRIRPQLRVIIPSKGVNDSHSVLIVLAATAVDIDDMYVIGMKRDLLDSAVYVGIISAPLIP